jgi:hypothetical protein
LNSLASISSGRFLAQDRAWRLNVGVAVERVVVEAEILASRAMIVSLPSASSTHGAAD